jgi:hypothetical protein
MYLLHGLLLWAAFQWLVPHQASRNMTVFVGLAVSVAAVLVLLSSAVFLAIERPATLLGKRHYRWVVNIAAVLWCQRYQALARMMH